MSVKANTGKVFNLTSGGNMPESVYDPNRKRTDVYEYAELAIAAAIDELYEELLNDQAIYHVLYDSSGDSVLDSAEDAIKAQIAITIK